uniref:Uncharacterized protein n=1 Tax=Meloidogyne javanica TaxID=6303 RepID=A0A915LV40_MELJA
MADHEAANNGHTAQFHILRNPYMDRVCRFIYNDCDYGERNGGLDNVLKRKEELLSKQTSLIQQQLIRATTTAIMKSEQL